MRFRLLIATFIIISMPLTAQTKFISTGIGNIAVHCVHRQSNALPIVFLHGVYFDHHLWDLTVNQIHDRTLILIDMPLHGESREITKHDWSLNDCAEMLIEILHSLQIPKVIAVGHSWGGMTILRAAFKHPEKFEALGLCNMPFEAATSKHKRIIKLQHTMLFFRNFYTRQTAKSLFGKSSLKTNPKLLVQLQRPMNTLSAGDIKETDKKVIMDAEDATHIILGLQVKAIALKGKEDYVPAPPRLETLVIEGGHISPLENSPKILELIDKLIQR